MPSDPLLPSNREIEQALAQRFCPEPSADLRDRIRRAVSAQRDSAGRLPLRPGWKYVWQAAAAIVVALNLWMTAANTVRVGRLAPADMVEDSPPPGMAEPEAPDTFDTNDPLNQLAVRALANLAPAPQAGVLGRNFFSNEEEHEWALP
jgi:hypothetical protein